MDTETEKQVRKHIAEYRKKGYSEKKIREALLENSVDSQTVSQLMLTEKKFYTHWWFLLPMSILLFFFLLFVYFLLFVA